MISDSTFYPAVLNAGAILWGFCGTFLAFRIQREASYFRQPVLDFHTATGKNVTLKMQQLSCSFVVLLFATLSSAVFGFILPLLGLNGHVACYTQHNFLVGGLIFSLVLILSYFVAELYHYRIICRND